MGQICITYVTNHFTLFGTVNLAIQSDTFQTMIPHSEHQVMVRTNV